MKNMLGIVPAWDSHPDGSLKDCPHTSDVDLAQGKRGEFLDNDTIWRSMADLNRILLYADRKGILQPARQRRYLAIVDGIVAGEASQYEPRPRPLSSIIIGFGPVTADAVAARVAGFDPRLLRSIVQPASKGNYGLGPAHSSEILVVLRGAGSVQEFCTAERIIVPESDIYPWVGHVEANDFAPPHLSWRYEGERQRLLVQAEDPAGVAYVRLACRRQGQPRTIALDRQGDAKRGEWSSPLPAIEQLDSLWLTAADELFNATSVPLKL
jgi:hypothetical protein